jgi:hypothetical protein
LVFRDDADLLPLAEEEAGFLDLEEDFGDFAGVDAAFGEADFTMLHLRERGMGGS